MNEPNYAQFQQAPIKPLLDHVVSNDFNRYIQQMTDELYKFDLFLTGQRIFRDDKGDTKVVTECQARVNSIGRQEIMGRMTMFLNQNTWMSQISSEDTTKNQKLEVVAFARLLADNHVKYHLTIENARIIRDMVAQVFFFAMRKAETDKPTIFDTMNSTNVQPTQQGQQGMAGQVQGIFKH